MLLDRFVPSSCSNSDFTQESEQSMGKPTLVLSDETYLVILPAVYTTAPTITKREMTT